MRLHLECYADEALAMALGVSRKAIIHNPGKGSVAKQLAKQSSVIGLVDEDPGSAEPTTLARFSEVEFKHGVRFKKDSKTGNALVVLCPRLEDWAIKTAKEAGLALKEFNLPDDPSELHAVINTRLNNFRRFLDELLRRQNQRLAYLRFRLGDVVSGSRENLR